MNILKHIPNLFTLGNLSCGTLAILNIFEDRTEQAVYLVLFAAVLDFFDGFLARLFKVSGELGKQLDSLADLVTFGVAPSFLLYSLAAETGDLIRFSFVLPAVFSALRLAKFNIDTRQSTSFIGVPTPVTGIMVMSWAMVEDSSLKDMLFGNDMAFLLFCLTISLLLVSGIRLPSMKLKKGPWSDYTQHIILFITGLISLIFFGWLCIPVFYASYVLSSILFNFAAKSSS